MKQNLHAVTVAGVLLAQAVFPPRVAAQSQDIDALIMRASQREHVRQHGVSFSSLDANTKSLEVSNLLNWVSKEDIDRSNPTNGISKDPFRFAPILYTIQGGTVNTQSNFKGFLLADLKSDVAVVNAIDQALSLKRDARFSTNVTNSKELYLYLVDYDLKLDTWLWRLDGFRNPLHLKEMPTK